MNPVSFERYLQRVKMTLSRDTDVLGVLYVGPLMDVESAGEVQDTDFLIVSKTDVRERYLSDLSWLPDAEQMVASAEFGPGNRHVLLSDGRLVRLSVYELDVMPSVVLGPFRVLLDRGGIGRLARTLSSDRLPDVRPALPELVTADHLILLAWSAYLFRKRGDETRAERLADLAMRAAEQAFAGDASVADRLSDLARESVRVSIPGLVALVGERLPGMTAGLSAVEQWLGAPERPRWPEPRPDPRTDEVEEAPLPEPEPTGPVVEAFEGPREPVLRQDACPFCGSALGAPGRLYQKGTLKDIRYLEGLSATLDFKQKVIARPCTACGQISLRLDEG